MPKLRKIAQRAAAGNSSSIPTREARSPLASNLAARISSSSARSALIPYAIRAVSDANRRLPLTTLQSRVLSALRPLGVQGRLLRRFEELPKKARMAFDARYLTVPAKEADELFCQTISKAFEATARQLVAAAKSKKDLCLPAGFSTLNIGYESLATMLAGSGAAPAPTPVYDFKLEYRGITTHETSDRLGGVEPYLVAGFYRLSDQQALEELVAPFVIKQRPWNLGDMDDDEWMPSGGSQDGAGNPSNPITMFLGEFPPLNVDKLYYSIVKVMEEDGGQGGEIAQQMGTALLGLVPVIVGAGVVSLVGALAAVVAGAVVAAIGLALELLGLLWSSSAADDPIGDLLMCFSQADICQGGFRELAQRANAEDDEWTLYFGATSTKVSG